MSMRLLTELSIAVEECSVPLVPLIPFIVATWNAGHDCWIVLDLQTASMGPSVL